MDTKEAYCIVVDNLKVKKAELYACKGNDSSSPIYQMVERELVELRSTLRYLNAELDQMK